VPIPDAKHDVFLSVAESRQTAYRELDHWLDWHIAWSGGQERWGHLPPEGQGDDPGNGPETADAAPQPERG
jgi:hypothetical protein